MVEYVKKGTWTGILNKLKAYRFPALILALGLGLMLLPMGGSREPAEQVAAAEASETFDLSAFTKEAEALLSDLQGAGEVRILFSLENDGTREYLSDISESQNGDSSQSSSQTVLPSGSGGENPVVMSRSYPKFRGAVVLCSGESPSLTLRIKEALSSLTGLGMDRISVLKMN